MKAEFRNKGDYDLLGEVSDLLVQYNNFEENEEGITEDIYNRLYEVATRWSNTVEYRDLQSSTIAHETASDMILVAKKKRSNNNPLVVHSMARYYRRIYKSSVGRELRNLYDISGEVRLVNNDSFDKSQRDPDIIDRFTTVSYRAPDPKDKIELTNYLEALINKARDLIESCLNLKSRSKILLWPIINMVLGSSDSMVDDFEYRDRITIKFVLVELKKNINPKLINY